MRKIACSAYLALFVGFVPISAMSQQAADTTYYTIYIRAEEWRPEVSSYESFEAEFQGYAWLDLSNPGDVRGRFCLIGVEPFDMAGTRQEDGSLSLRIGAFPELAILGPDDGYFQLIEDFDAPVVDWDLDSDFTFTLGDRQFDPIEFEMKEIPVEALRAFRSDPGPLARLGMDEAFARLRDEDNRNIFPGRAIVIADAARRMEWESAMSEAPAMLPEENGVDSACEPPILIEEVEVPAIIEDWAAQRLMASNTVIHAAPIEQEGGPEGYTTEVESGPLYDLWFSAESAEDYSALDDVFETTFRDALLRYANERSAEIVELARDLSTFDHVFKFEILGRGLNVCDRWEKFTLDIRVAARYTRLGQVGIELIVLEPLYSPGQVLRGGARFAENEMTPNDLDMLEDDIIDFLELTDFGFVLDRADSRDWKCNTL